MARQVRNVYADTLDAEMEHVRALAERYKYVALDAEFPGVVVRPIGSFGSVGDFNYQTLRYNVDLLRLIQLGITFADENGEMPEDCPTWQFNFRFSLEEDMYSQETIDLLTRAGIDFASHAEKGIDVEAFGEVLMSSGLVLCDDVKWITFHGGFDYGYLVKLLTNASLPAEEEPFLELLRTYFPCVYDVKQLVSASPTAAAAAAAGSSDGLTNCGLQRVAEDLAVPRVSADALQQLQQAGSDSLLTAAVFFHVRKAHFAGRIDDVHRCALYNFSAAARA